MRVLHVITAIDRGGAENHLADLAMDQARRGFHVAVAYLKGDGYWQASLRAARVQVQSLQLSRYGEIAPALRLNRLMRDFLPHLVHAHLPPAELYTRMALMGLPASPIFLITKHNDEPFHSGPGHRWLGHWVAGRSALVIAISDAVKAYAGKQWNLAPARIRTVHYGIDPAPFEAVDEGARQALRSEWGIASAELVIGSVGRLVPQKALHVLLAAFARYGARSQRPARLVIVGRGPLEAELKEMSRSLGIARDVVWAGFREDIPVAMSAFDVFALTSAYEGFGLVLLEAMSAARPVVATAVSAVPEIVEDGATGILCRPGDADRVTDALLRLDDPNLRARFGQAGRARVKEQFTLTRMVESTLAVYQECLA